MIVGCLPGLFSDDHGVARLYSNGQQWAHDWCEARTKWYMDMRWSNDVIKSEPLDQKVPGFLLVGDINSVTNWMDIKTAGEVICMTPALVRPVSAAILRSAHLPKVSHQPLKTVA